VIRSSHKCLETFWIAQLQLRWQLAMDKNQFKFVPTPRRRTFVCHIVNEVEVITAKRCPVRDILRASSGSVSADLENEVSWLGIRVERFCSESFSTGLMPGVTGVIGVGEIGGWSSSFALSSDAVLGASTSDPLPSVVARDSASSSNSKTCSLAALLLLAAYTRGAPMGQYMAARCRIPHS